MIAADYHTHSAYSADAKASMREMAEQALNKGLTYLCFTDHMDYDYPKEYHTKFEFDVPSYFREAAGLKEEYAGRLEIRTGIELGMQPHLASRCKALITAYPFDFVLCSSHLSNGLDPYYPAFWEGKSIHEALLCYFESILSNIKVFDDFDVCGHLDYICRYIPRDSNHSRNPLSFGCYGEFRDIIDEILLLLLSKGKGIEINTCGFKSGINHPNPHEDIIRRYCELGGGLITIGSDAHKPDHLAYDFNQIRALLLSLGLDKYAVFTKRKPSFLPL